MKEAEEESDTNDDAVQLSEQSSKIDLQVAWPHMMIFFFYALTVFNSHNVCRMLP